MTAKIREGSDNSALWCGTLPPIDHTYVFHIFHIKSENTKLTITSVQMIKMTSYLNHDIIPRIEIFPEILVKMRHSNVT